MTISVVIPSYNGSRHIEQAIQSVLDQQRQPDEILVCDDNSTDNTLEVCGRYKDCLSIHVNPDGPSGFVRGWNKAIARAKGEYVCILHQDDMLSPEFIRMGMEALEKDPDVRHLFSTCRYIDDRGRTLGCSYDARGRMRFSGREYFLAYQGLGNPHIHRCPGVITHKSLFDECPYEPLAGHIADDDFFYRVGMFTDVIGILTPLASFRIHGESVTGGLEDMALAERLMNDYIYQCRQWKGHPFVHEHAYGYFVRNAYKYIRRCIGYGIRRRNIPLILKGIRRWRELRQFG